MKKFVCERIEKAISLGRMKSCAILYLADPAHPAYRVASMDASTV